MRYLSKEVRIGKHTIGGNRPVVVQTMANIPLSHIEELKNQIHRLLSLGCEMIRVSVPNMQDVQRLKKLKEMLISEGANLTLIADVHFKPEVALACASFVDKVRINPGNYCENKAFAKYTSEDDRIAMETIKQNLLPLVQVCKQNGTAIRIGTNHGSLSKRIVFRFGHTAEALVASSMEFLRVLSALDFHNTVVSIKSSNPAIMIPAYFLLCDQMQKENLCYPLHIGVTEAGCGKEGIALSAAGISPLLFNGIGDTIRVSLTGSPESEIPVANKFVALFPRNNANPKTKSQKNVITSLPGNTEKKINTFPLTTSENDKVPKKNKPDALLRLMPEMIKSGEPIALRYLSKEKTFETYNYKQGKPDAFLFYKSPQMPLNACYSAISTLYRKTDKPIVAVFDYSSQLYRNNLPRIFSELSILICSGYVQTYCLWSSGKTTDNSQEVLKICLQANGKRRSGVEYISCPSCGRTMFDIEAVSKLVKKKTRNLQGGKIAVMGCVVNGPGEMADAEYGYIGSGKNLVDIYYQGKIYMKKVPSERAVDELVSLIKEKTDNKIQP